MLKHRIREAYNRQEIVGIYDDREDMTMFWVGYIAAYSDDYVICGHITPNGLYDGFLLIDANRIFRIESHSMEIMRTALLYKLKGQEHPEYVSTSENLALSLLKYAMERRYIVTIEQMDQADNDVQGYVEGLDERSVRIKTYTKYGALDGEALLSMEDISFLSCDSDDDADLRLLLQNQESK